MPNKMTAAEAAEALEICARTSPCPAKCPRYYVDIDGPECARHLMESTASILRRVASGELAPVIHAHWEEVEPGHDILFQCSKCGRIISTSWGSCEDNDTQGCNGCDPTEEWLNCPSCGALMDGKDGIIA